MKKDETKTRKAAEEPDVRAAAPALADDDLQAVEIDETVPGGRYEVDGRTVNAHGEEIGSAPARKK
jgi:hypothetical protein